MTLRQPPAAGITGGYCLFNAALYALALMLMTAAFSRERSRSGIAEELSIIK